MLFFINKNTIRILIISGFNALQVCSINHWTIFQIPFIKPQENSHTYTSHVVNIFSFNTKSAERSIKYHWGMN
jgi:hypothetical protein